MNIHKVYLLLLSIIFLLPSCEKTPGEGGRASIIGHVEVETRTVLWEPLSLPDSVPWGALPSTDTEVFIVYGDNTGPDDRVFTNPDGDFSFNWLRPGDYTIYIYSEDTIEATLQDELPEIAIYKEVYIDDRNETLDAGVITIYDKP